MSAKTKEILVGMMSVIISTTLIMGGLKLLVKNYDENIYPKLSPTEKIEADRRLAMTNWEVLKESYYGTLDEIREAIK